MTSFTSKSISNSDSHLITSDIPTFYETLFLGHVCLTVRCRYMKV